MSIVVIITILLQTYLAAGTRIKSKAYSVVQLEVDRLTKNNHKLVMDSSKEITGESSEYLMNLLSDPVSSILTNNGHLYLYSNGTLFLINETSIIQRLQPIFEFNARMIVNSYSGFNRMIFLDHTGNSTLLVSLTSMNRTQTKPIILTKELNGIVKSTHSMILAQSEAKVFMQSFDKGINRIVHEFDSENEYVLKFAWIDNIYYVFTTRAVYRVDTLRWSLSLIESFPEAAIAVTEFKAKSEQYIAAFTEKRKLRFYLMTSKTQVERSLIHRFDFEKAYFLDEYLVLDSADRLIIHSLKNILKGRSLGLELIKVEENQYVFGHHQNKSSLKFFTRSLNYGLMTYSILEPDLIAIPDDHKGWQAFLNNPIYWMPIIISLIIFGFTYLKIKNLNNAKKEKEERNRKQIEQLMKKHRQQMAEISEQMASINERISNAGLDSLKQEMEDQQQRLNEMIRPVREKISKMR